MSSTNLVNKYNNKVLNDIYKDLPDNGLRLMKLIELIPNWETYLTDKQLEVANQYIKCLNASEVDFALNLNIGTTQQRLFGGSKSQGALGRLEMVVDKLQKQGYFDKLASKKEEQNKKVKVSKLSQDTKDKVRELLRLIADMPDYENYLTESQKVRVYQFFRLRSFTACAKYFNITEVTLKQSLLGRNNSSGVLGRLREAYDKKTVNSWDEI
jgi:hypothetical protein